MNTLIAKYVSAYRNETGGSTEKVKKVLMYYSHCWDWAAGETLIADLIDDTRITAADIVDFLSNTYEIEGGNEEFHYAVRALQICLRKAELAEMMGHIFKAEEPEIEESAEYENDLYMPKAHEILQTMQY